MVDYPKYAPDYARIEFNRLIDVWSDGKRRFQALNQWRNDSRMKFVYESLENSTKADNGYFILVMLDSYEIDLEKFKREDTLTCQTAWKNIQGIRENSVKVDRVKSLTCRSNTHERIKTNAEDGQCWVLFLHTDYVGRNAFK